MKENKSASNDYTFQEFCDHLEAQKQVRDYEHVDRNGEEVEIGKDDSYELNVIRTWDYFKQIYPEDVAMEKGTLFILMCSHLAENLSAYNTGDLAVQGGDAGCSLVSEPLLRAVHHYYTSRPLSELSKKTAVQEIKHLAATKFGGVE